MQIETHAGQSQCAAPDPIANRPPLEGQICQNHESGNHEAEQMREIERGECHETFDPWNRARLRQPAQPESHGQKSQRKAQVKIQKALKEKYAARNEQRPESRAIFARVGMTQEKPGGRREDRKSTRL